MALSADERNKKKKQHRGIFTQDNKKRKWDWTARLRYAEDVLEENFRWSPVYPFSGEAIRESGPNSGRWPDFLPDP